MLVQLFNLQIIHGKEYRETSNTKLSKEAVIQAARGKILDRTGTILADTQMGFNVQLFKTKATDEEINNAMLKLADIFEKNGDKYIDEFPISVEPFQYNFDSEEENKKILCENLENKKAYNKLLELVQNQGGDITYIENPNKFENAKYIKPIYSDLEGYIYEIDAKKVGKLYVENEQHIEEVKRNQLYIGKKAYKAAEKERK